MSKKNASDSPSAESSQGGNESIAAFVHDEGEILAAPFAEQIEDILRAKIKADPALQKYEIDLGTGANQTLEIWVDGKPYSSVDDLPDERLKEAFRAAVEKWNAK
ncbi:MAG: hypothetical protein HY867_08080 [Chloroflexi bacterium]|nr:hypothetical protein [Chloroflexota bacterium]